MKQNNSSNSFIATRKTSRIIKETPFLFTFISAVICLILGPSLNKSFLFSLQIDPKVAFPRRAHPKVSTFVFSFAACDEGWIFFYFFSMDETFVGRAICAE
jgi:hypothetical protein